MNATKSTSESLGDFSLIDEAWLPVIDLTGVQREVSLREALLQSHRYRDVSGELPSVRFAIMRVLLAIMYRVLDREPAESPTTAWRELWNMDRLPPEGFERYLCDWRHRFNLIDEQQPFLQTPDLRTEKGEWKPVSLIVADSNPDGALFTMRSELYDLSLAEAARWLIHAHAYDYSGIKSGAVGDPRVKGGKGYPMGIGCPPAVSRAEVLPARAGMIHDVLERLAGRRRAPRSCGDDPETSRHQRFIGGREYK